MMVALMVAHVAAPWVFWLVAGGFFLAGFMLGKVWDRADLMRWQRRAEDYRDLAEEAQAWLETYLEDEQIGSEWE